MENNTYKNFKNCYFNSLDHLEAIVFVSGAQDDIVYYINNYTLKLFGDIVGKKRQESINLTSTLTTEMLLKMDLFNEHKHPDKHYRWKYYSELDHSWYQAYDQFIKIDDDLFRFHIAYPIKIRDKDEGSILDHIVKERLISEILSIINHPDFFESQIMQSLRLMTSYQNLTRSFICELDENNHFVLTYQFPALDKECIDAFDNENCIYNKLGNLLLKNHILISDSKADKSIAEIKLYTEKRNINSFLILPIYLEEEIKAYIGWENKNERTWDHIDTDQLETIAGVLANAFLRKKNEQKLIDSEKQLLQANTTKDKFFSIIAHDLKNPFTSIIGFSDLLIKNINNYNDEKKLEFLKMIHLSAKNVYNLLENLLLWSRSQSNKIEIRPEKIKPDKIIFENVLLFTPSAKYKDIKIEYSFIPDIEIFADKQMFNTVIRNIISNALKFTNQGGKINISLEKSENKAFIIISDNGIGMSAEQMNKLFQIDKSAIREGTGGERGSGLGLILCKEFVAKNKGEMFIESNEGKGTKVTVCFEIAIDKQ
jgi:signal transduction histidine kinase